MLSKCILRVGDLSEGMREVTKALFGARLHHSAGPPGSADSRAKGEALPSPLSAGLGTPLITAKAAASRDASWIEVVHHACKPSRQTPHSPRLSTLQVRRTFFQRPRRSPETSDPTQRFPTSPAARATRDGRNALCASLESFVPARSAATSRYLFQKLAQRKSLCEPSHTGIFLEWPQMQSWMPLPARMRGVQASMRETRVADCLAALKCRR